MGSRQERLLYCFVLCLYYLHCASTLVNARDSSLSSSSSSISSKASLEAELHSSTTILDKTGSSSASSSLDASPDALPEFDVWRESLFGAQDPPLPVQNLSAVPTGSASSAATKRHAKQYVVGESDSLNDRDAVQAGYASGSQTEQQDPLSRSARQADQASKAVIEPVISSKISKDRFNYASFDCGAIVLAANAGAKHATSILIENKDHYMLNECRTDKKYLMIELCDDILIESVTMANLEFFSSIFHRFTISVSDRYPPKPTVGWQSLGEFHAFNVKDLQTFRIANPVMWARYMRIDFLSHFGQEYYCPISLLRVHGKRMMEDFKETEDLQPVSPLPIDTAEPSTSLSNQTSPPGKPVKDKASEGDHGTSGTTTSDWEHILLDITRELGQMTEKTHEQQQHENGSVSSSSSPAPSPIPSSPPSAGHVGNETEDDTLVNPPTPADQNTPPSVVVPAPPAFNSQSSVFKTITKRLNALEFNSTLSLKYLELQTRRLNEVFASLDKNQQKRLQESTRRAENWSRDRWSTLRELIRSKMKKKRQHDTILKGLVQELDTFEKDMQTAMQSLEGKLKAINDEILFYNRIYLVLLIALVALIFIYTQASRLRHTLPLLFERPQRVRENGLASGPTADSRLRMSSSQSRQSQEELARLEKLRIEEGPEDDADVLTLGPHVTHKRLKSHMVGSSSSAPTSPSMPKSRKPPVTISSSSPDVFSPTHQRRPKSTGDMLASPNSFSQFPQHATIDHHRSPLREEEDVEEEYPEHAATIQAYEVSSDFNKVVQMLGPTPLTSGSASARKRKNKKVKKKGHALHTMFVDPAPRPSTSHASTDASSAPHATTNHTHNSNGAQATIMSTAHDTSRPTSAPPTRPSWIDTPKME